MSDTKTELLRKFDEASKLHQEGNIASATKLYREILAADKSNPDALHMLGVIAQQNGNSLLALRLIEGALSHNAKLASAWSNRAIILRQEGRPDEAMLSVQEALRIEPNLAAAWDTMGLLNLSKNQVEEAIKNLRHALELAPDNPQILNNLATAFLASGDIRAAYDTAKKLSDISDSFPLIVLGNILKSAGYPDRALPHYKKTVARFPEYKEFRVNLATCHLQMGDFEDGLKLWEDRPDVGNHFAHLPYWKGKRIKKLIVYEDQGSGDALQCARYLPQLQNYAKQIALGVAAPLKSIFKDNFPAITVFNIDEPGILISDAEARVRMMSLPFLLASNLVSRAPLGAYLSADKSQREIWRARLSTMPKPRVGLVWGGNPKHLKERERSIPFMQLYSFVKKHAANIVSLQKGPQKAEADLSALNVLDTDPLLTDFSVTAALIAELDLLISVDTACVHLAGALGVPCWLLTPFDPDFRWQLAREDSPLYPRLRLFRQSSPGIWGDVIERIDGELRKLNDGHLSVLVPQIWTAPLPRQNPLAIELDNAFKPKSSET